MRSGDQIPWREVVVSVIGGIGIPVVASLVLPALPKGVRLPVGLAIGGLVLVAGALYILVSLRRQIAASERLVLSNLEGYDFDTESGALLKGNISNVSLRRTTLHALIDGIVRAVDSERRASLLYEVGHATGESWGREFEALFRRARLGATELADKLALWADYDASAGMGRLSFDLAESGEGAVVLANSFLSDSAAAAPLNHWFAGYLAGTLSHLLGHEVNVALVDPTPHRQLVTTFNVARA